MKITNLYSRSMQLFKLRQLLLQSPDLSQLSLRLLLQDPDLDHVLAADVVVMVRVDWRDSAREVLMMVVVVRMGRAGAKR